MTAIKILLAHNHYLISGGESQVLEAELGLLRDNGHEVDVYIEDNLRVAELGNLNTAARTIWSMETYQQVRSKLSLGQYDIVHVHNFFPLISPSIYYAARAEGIPLVQTLHNFRLLCINGILFRDGAVCEECIGRSLPWPGIYNACYRDSHKGSLAVAAMLALHRAIRTWDRMIDTYIALTEFSRRKFIEGGLPENKITLKPNTIAKDPGQGLGQGQFAVFVGRLSPEKGVNTLLEAWGLLGESVPLRIIGDGPLRDEVISAAESSPSVDYLGRLENDQVLNQMKDALFLVFPSLQYENFPITFVEAYATGLPILASNLGNAADLISRQQSGLLFEAGNPLDLANQAASLAKNRDALRDMRTTARATFEESFTATRNYHLLMDIYRNTIAKSENGI
jgi:glycosyltransferase involved in cell wall biosynthesis